MNTPPDHSVTTPDRAATPHWKAQAERSNAFWVQLLARLALFFGRTFILGLLHPIVLYFFLTGGSAKNASREALFRFTGKQPSQWAIFRHLYTFALVAVDRIFLLAGRTQLFDVTLHGEEIFTRLRSSGRGCILLVSHAGSFDVMRVPATREQQLPMKILMDKHHNGVAMALINSLDPQLASQVIDARQPAAALALQLKEEIDHGAMIGIMADRAGPGEETVHVPFAGGFADFPIGPWMLAWVLQVPVVFCFGLYRGGNRYEIHFEELTAPLHGKRSQRRAIVQAAVAHFAARLQHHVARAPFNWFNFYSFWHDETPADH